MCYEGLFLLYRFRVEHQANLYTCRLAHKIVKFMEISLLCVALYFIVFDLITDGLRHSSG